MNLMLNVSTQPVKVLQHMYEVSAPGCILGISVWGNKANSTFLVLFEKAREHFGIEEDPEPSPFRLYNKLEGIANEVGWEMVQ